MNIPTWQTLSMIKTKSSIVIICHCWWQSTPKIWILGQFQSWFIEEKQKILGFCLNIKLFGGKITIFTNFSLKFSKLDLQTFVKNYLCFKGHQNLLNKNPCNFQIDWSLFYFGTPCIVKRSFTTNIIH